MRGLLRFLLWTALVLGALVGLLRATTLRWWTVPEGDAFLTASVAPTLKPGDVVLLWRLTSPGFGDLVLCPEPNAPERIVIGRLVGEAGDDLEISGGKVKLGRKQASDEMSCGEFTVEDPNTGVEVTQRCDVEVLNTHRHFRGNTSGHKVVPEPVKVSVPEGTVFLLSDNRLFPYDSRDFGPVPRETCKEFIFFRLVGKGGYLDQGTRLTVIR
jgi:signal peptidase I